jgi:16S rRNA C1402 (ribose-2'-O) methylase RsmI
MLVTLLLVSGMSNQKMLFCGTSDCSNRFRGKKLEQWKKEVAYIAGESTSESKQVKPGI